MSHTIHRITSQKSFHSLGHFSDLSLQRFWRKWSTGNEVTRSQLPTSQLSGNGSNHTCIIILRGWIARLPKKWHPAHTRNHSHRFNELATKSGKWNGKSRLAMYVTMFDNHWSPQRLLYIYSSGCAEVNSREMTGQIDTRLAGKTSIASGSLASRRSWSVEELETQPAGTKHAAKEIISSIAWKWEREA